MEEKVNVLIFEDRSSGRVIRIFNKDEVTGTFSKKGVLDAFIEMGCDLFRHSMVEKTITKKEYEVLEALYGEAQQS